MTSSELPSRLQIAVVGPARFGIGEPYAGGLECHVATLSRGMVAAGHDVTVFAGPATAATPTDLAVVPIVDLEPDLTGFTRLDNSNPPGRSESEADGYHRVLERIDDERYDVVHNASLHRLPVVRGDGLRAPVVHALHTPPFAELEAAHLVRDRRPTKRSAVVAVSATLADQWGRFRPSVVANGVDCSIWRPGDGSATPERAGAVWAGRIVPEKGPHLAIAAARLAGLPITLAGPVHDSDYYRTAIVPLLRGDTVHIGHITAAALAELFDRAAVGSVTPCWPEPFGLVAAEMLASGLPVAAFDRGALSSIVDPKVGRLVPPDDVPALAEAMTEAGNLDRISCRRHARQHFSTDSMVSGYLAHYERLIMADAGLRRVPTPESNRGVR